MTGSNYLLQEHHPLEIPIHVWPSRPQKKHNEEWIILQKLVSSHPCHDDDNDNNKCVVATVWQVAKANQRTQRVAVYSGTALFNETENSGFSGNSLHVSFQLPVYAQPPSVDSHSVFCWTTFPSMDPKHKVLCCLVATTSLCIWDVYPQSPQETSTHDSNSGGGTSVLPSEGWTVTLPFECRAIFSVPGSGGGLFLQRLEDVDDRVAMSTLSVSEDDGFFLKGPPTLNKTHQIKVSSQASASPFGIEPQVHLPITSSSAVPSLFSLHHPLDDVLPVVETTVVVSSLSSDPLQQFQGCTPVTDVFERLLWIGTSTWVDSMADDSSDEGIITTHQSAVFAVTYHTIFGRHAVWKIEEAPSAPDSLPLHKVIKQKYRCDAPTMVLDAHNDMIIMNEMQQFQDSSSDKHQMSIPIIKSSIQPKVSRDDALADALGVRRTPRKSLDMPKTLYRSSDQHQGAQHHVGANGPTSFFSPSSAVSPTNISNPSGSDQLNGFSDVLGNALPSNLSGLSSNRITAKSALKCVYREQNDTSSMATNVFLASNLESCCKTILCLVCKRKTRTTRNGCPQELKLYSLIHKRASHPNRKTSVKDQYNTTIQLSKEVIGCISAQPIEAAPIPACFYIESKHRTAADKTSSYKPMATDILVIDKQSSMILYRSSIAIASCTLPKAQKVAELEDPVKDSITFRVVDQNSEDVAIRGKLTLVVENNFLVENVVSAIESSLHASTNEINRNANGFPITNSFSSQFLKILSLKIRADCCRLLRTLTRSKTSTKGRGGAAELSCHDPFENVYYSSLRTVILAIADYELAITNTIGNKIKSQSKIGEDDAWIKLLQSEYHQTYSMENSFFLGPKFGNLDVDVANLGSSDNVSATKLSSIRSLSVQHLRGSRSKNSSDSNIFSRIFDSIHHFNEDLKLYYSSPNSEQPFVVSLLVDLCQKVIAAEGQSTPLMEEFLAYYKKDHGERIRKTFFVTEGSAQRSFKKKFAPGTSFTSFSKPPSINLWIEGAMQLNMDKMNQSSYNHNTPLAVNGTCARTRCVLRIFSVFLEAGSYASTPMQRCTHMVKILTEEGFFDSSQIRESFPPGVSVPILEVLYFCRNASPSADLPDWPLEAWSLIGRNDIRKNIEAGLLCSKFTKAEKTQYLRSNQLFGAMEADCDDENDSDGLVSIELRAAMLFRDDNRIHEAARLVRSSRPILLRLARAVEVSDHDFERLKQEKLLLLAFRALALPIGRGMLTIGSLQPIPAEPLPIPDLCLKGRVPPTNATISLDLSECPTDMRVWPDFHNGVAAGLRLPTEREMQGREFKINRTWIVYNRPPVVRPSSDDSNESTNQQPQHKTFAHGGFLLALGLRGHLTALEMSDIYDYLTHGTVTTTVGVLLGLAANKRGSCDISISKMLCLHIPSLIPQHFSAIDVASSVQSAAILGAGLLYQKSSHRMMTEFLLNEIGKRPESDVSTFDREAYTLACGLALGTVNLAIGEKKEGFDRAAGIADLGIEGRLHRYVIGGIDVDENWRTREANDRFSLPSASGNDNERCSTISESDQINTDVTAAGSTLALGLMYMKTGNQTIASALALPQTHFLLEFVRPDFLGLRVIARSLILWNDVFPTRKWIEQQVPAVVRDSYEEIRSVAKAAFGGRNRHSRLRPPKPEYDRRAIRQIYPHVVSSACFGIGIRYAGTGDDRAKAALYERILEFHNLRESFDPISLALKPELPILEMCLGSVAIALAMVMAGTGDLDTLRVFKVLRWRCDKTSNYGSHMIYGMAIGLLFLGGGTCTLGREPEDIACLVTAFFPRFPRSTADNQYHLQAARHLYALAVKQKELHAVDVDTGESACVSIDILVDTNSPPQRLIAPALLRNTDKVVKQLQIVGDKYYPLKFDLSDTDSSYVFYVKKRCSSSAVISSRCGSIESTLKDLLSFSFRKKYASFLYEKTKNDRLNLSTEALVQSRVEDREDEYFLYLCLLQSIQVYGNDSALYDWYQRHLKLYYKERKRFFGGNAKALLDTELLIPLLCEITELNLMANA